MLEAFTAFGVALLLIERVAGWLWAENATPRIKLDISFDNDRRIDDGNG